MHRLFRPQFSFIVFNPSEHDLKIVWQKRMLNYWDTSTPQLMKITHCMVRSPSDEITYRPPVSSSLSWNHFTIVFGAPKVRQVKVTVLPSTVRALAAGAVVISGGRAGSERFIYFKQKRNQLLMIKLVLKCARLAAHLFTFVSSVRSLRSLFFDDFYATGYEKCLRN